MAIMESYNRKSIWRTVEIKFILIDQGIFDLSKQSKASISNGFSSVYTFQIFGRSNPNRIAIKAASRIHSVDSDISIRNSRQSMLRISFATVPTSLTIIDITGDNLGSPQVNWLTAASTSNFNQV
jgi:hypothetical protein